MFELLFEVCLDVKVVLLVVPSVAGVSDWAVVVQSVTQIVPICNNKLSRGEICGANLKAPLRMVMV